MDGLNVLEDVSVPAELGVSWCRRMGGADKDGGTDKDGGGQIKTGGDR